MRAIIASVALLVCACSTPPVSMPSLSPTPLSSITSLPTATATPAASPSANLPRTPTPISDVAQVFTATGPWRPAGTTLVLASIAEADHTASLVAITLGPSGRIGAPTPIVTFPVGPWSIRSDGSAVALAVATTGGSRMAIWDARTATARWLTTPVPGRLQSGPVWSLDGASLFYAEMNELQALGIFQIGADGSGKRLIAGSIDRLGPPQELTPDGKGLVWSRGQAGGSVEILDIATGVSRHIEDNARVASWRPQQPRMLVMVGGCCAGRPGGSLVAFDDVAMTSSVIAERSPRGEIAWGAGDWDPTGARIVAGRYDTSSPYEAGLVVLDPGNGVTEAIAGTQGAGFVQWLPEGILFSIGHDRQPRIDLMLLPSGAATPLNLYTGENFAGAIVVRP